MTLTCFVCKKTSAETPMKRCAKCLDAAYCSRECQVEDWKNHKQQCGTAKDKPAKDKPAKAKPAKAKPTPSAASGGSSSRRGGAGGKLSPPKGVDAGVSDPFTRLDRKVWLHGRSETDVYRLLLDAYRLRANDDYNMEGTVDADGLLGGNPSALPAFRRFLTKVEGKSGLLPSWWNAEKRKACEAMGMDSGVWQNLMCAVEKSDIIDHYGDGQFPMQLRMFAETALGRGPGGQSGRGMMQMLMAMESGSMGDMQATTINIGR